MPHKMCLTQSKSMQRVFRTRNFYAWDKVVVVTIYFFSVNKYQRDWKRGREIKKIFMHAYMYICGYEQQSRNSLKLKKKKKIKLQKVYCIETFSICLEVCNISLNKLLQIFKTMFNKKKLLKETTKRNWQLTWGHRKI